MAPPGALPPAIEAQSFDLTALAPPERHFWTSGYAARIRIDPEGIRVEYADSKSKTLGWNDPNLVFGLADLRSWIDEDGTVNGSTPAPGKEFRFYPGSWGALSTASPVWITMEVFRALRAAGTAAGMHVFEGAFDWKHNLLPPWTRVTGFTRKKPGMTQIVDEDPPPSP